MEIESPILSIIIPVYNIEKYLKRCLDSIIKQIQPNIEILLINDGSTDSSIEICKIYSEHYPNITAFHKTNGGLSDARNYGINEANGRYIMFLDGDDQLNADALKMILPKLLCEQDFDVVIGRYLKYFEVTNTYIECDYQLNQSLVEASTGEAIFEALFFSSKHYDWYAWLNIIKKKFLVEQNLFFHPGILYEDVFWTPNVLYQSKKTGFVSYPFYIYTMNRPGAITTQFNKKTFNDKISCCFYIQNFCYTNFKNPQIAKVVLGNMYQIYTSLLMDIYKLDSSDRENHWADIKELAIIWRYSKKFIHKFFYTLEFIFGIRLTAGFLYFISKFYFHR